MNRTHTPAGPTLGISLCILIGLAGCQQPPISIQVLVPKMVQGRTMGTSFVVKYMPAGEMADEASVLAAIEKELAEVNAQMSTYIASSEISTFNNSSSTDWVKVSRDTAEVVQLAQEISKQTRGAFDITVGPLVDLWGFGPSGKLAQTPSQESISQARARCGYAKLEVRLDEPALRKMVPNLRIDLSGIAKGHGVDRVALLLESLGIESYFVEIGGEVRAAGRKSADQPWRVGVERPIEGIRELQTAVDISDRAMATSGNYRSYYELEGEKRWHTIDPQTGQPAAAAILSASVIADSCAEADAFATALMVLGQDAGSELVGRSNVSSMMIMPPNAESSQLGIHYSSGFPQDADSSITDPLGTLP